MGRGVGWRCRGWGLRGEECEGGGSVGGVVGVAVAWDPHTVWLVILARVAFFRRPSDGTFVALFFVKAASSSLSMVSVAAALAILPLAT